jgi:hypothetical protein
MNRRREAIVRQKYRRMLAAVRQWVAVAHPRAEVIDVVDDDGNTLARLLAEPDDRYELGVLADARN